MTGFSHNVGHWVAVAAGGAIGATLRFWVANRLVGVPTMPAWPWGTFTVNLCGSFAFGLLAVWLASASGIGVQMRFLLMTGLLGAFTTYSTFSFEVVDLIENHAWRLAGFYGVGTLLACVTAAGLGLALGRTLFE